MGDSDYIYEFSLSPLQGDAYFNNLVAAQDFSVNVNFTLPSDDLHVVIHWDLRVSGAVKPEFEQELVSCLGNIYFPSSLRNALISAITDVFRRRPTAASTPLSFGVRAVINLYEIERGEEDEELLHDSEVDTAMEFMLTSSTTSSPSSRGVVEDLDMVRIEGGGTEAKCAVCLEEFSVGLEAAKLPCSHVFHGGCIRRWLEKRDTCPLCRDVVGVVDDETTISGNLSPRFEQELESTIVPLSVRDDLVSVITAVVQTRATLTSFSVGVRATIDLNNELEEEEEEEEDEEDEEFFNDMETYRATEFMLTPSMTSSESRGVDLEALETVKIEDRQP
ncbi:hypothetical protein V2J09_004621 [Rumex salicifolius]